MYQRQTLQAFGSCRPAARSSLRIRNARYASQILPGNRQRAQEKGSNTMETNPEPKEMNEPPPYHKPVQHNQPNFSKTRQQRGAQKSDEVRVIDRDSPSSSVKGSPNPEFRAIQSKSIDPEAVGRSPQDPSVPLGGQMGVNEPDISNEGSQNIGRRSRNISEDDDLQNNRNSFDVEAEAQAATGAGGGSELAVDEDAFDELDEEDVFDAQKYALEQGRAVERRGRVKESLEEYEDDDEPSLNLSHLHELHLLEQVDKEDVTDVPYNPKRPAKQDYLYLGQGGATIAARNSMGVIKDRLEVVGAPTQGGVRAYKHIRSRLRDGHLVTLKNHSEIGQINGKYIPHDQVPSNKVQWAPLPKKFGTSLVDKMVRGQYPDMAAKPHAQHVLNVVGLNMNRNGTYLTKDTDRFLKKVQSLLPAQAASKPSKARKAA